MHIGPAGDYNYKERMLRTFQQLCSAPEGEEPWPALNGGPGQPGPFERGWRGFLDLHGRPDETRYYAISKARGRYLLHGIPVK